MAIIISLSAFLMAIDRFMAGGVVWAFIWLTVAAAGTIWVYLKPTGDSGLPYIFQ